MPILYIIEPKLTIGLWTGGVMKRGRWTGRVALALLMLSASSAFAQEHGNRPTGDATERKSHNDAVYSLYDLMSGLWNAPPGGTRAAEACDVNGEIMERVRKLATRPIPEYAAMIRSSIALKQACDDNLDSSVNREIDQIGILFYRSRIARMVFK